MTDNIAVTAKPKLNNLPVEIAAMIFIQLGPADLISTMMSCHAVLDLYLASETQIKDNIKAKFGDNYLDLVLYEAAPICPPMEQGAWSEFKVQDGKVRYPEGMIRICQMQRQFISICFDKDLASPLLTLPQYSRPTLGALDRFSKHMQAIDGFIRQYLNCVHEDLPFMPHGQRSRFNIAHSAAEQVRLRRGFIRYEMVCQLTARSRWNVMLGLLDCADEESAEDREWAVRRLAMSESAFLEALPYVVVAEVTSVASFVFSRHQEMLMDFFGELFDSRKSITPTGEEVEEEPQPDDEQPGSSRQFIPDEWEKENLLYLSSAVGMGLGYLEKVQRLSDMSRRAWFRTILGHFQPAEHSHYLGLVERWNELVRPLEELGGTFEAEELVRMPPQPRPGSQPFLVSYDAAMYPGFDHIFSGRAASEYSLTTLMEMGWAFWDLDRTEALDRSLRLGSVYSNSIWRVLHTGAEEDSVLHRPFWLPELGWHPIIKKMLTPDFNASDPPSMIMGTPSGMKIGSGHGRRWEKDDEKELSMEERADRAKERLQFFRDLMSNLDRYYALGSAGKI